MLMYADDLTLINDTVGRIQSELNVLHRFCENYGMTVNLNKTKVIVFRNGGVLRNNEQFYLANHQIEITTYYKYLGIMFSSKLKWTCAVQTLQKGIARHKVTSQKMWWLACGLCTELI